MDCADHSARVRSSERNHNIVYLFAKERNDKANANSWLLLKYEFMIRFYETPDFPIDKNNLNEEIEKTTQEIRKLLS